MTGASPAGLLAGSGELPLLAAKRLDEQGRDIVVCALDPDTHENLESISRAWMEFEPEAIDEVPEFFHDHGVEELYLLGDVDKTRLYDDGRVSSASQAVKGLMDRLPNKGDRYLIRAATHYLENKGLSVRGLDELFSDSQMPEGHQVGPELDDGVRETIEYLLPLARESADHEIGQTLIGKRQSVVAVEAVEGTQEAIERAGRLAGDGCVMVKTARSNQNPRFDMPVVGPETIQSLTEINATALAVQSDQVLWMKQEESREIARDAQLSVLGVSIPSAGIFGRLKQWLNG